LTTILDVGVEIREGVALDVATPDSRKVAVVGDCPKSARADVQVSGGFLGAEQRCSLWLLVLVRSHTYSVSCEAIGQTICALASLMAGNLGVKKCR
jgi:hypothetical protein